MNLYTSFLKPLLFQLDAETAHHLALSVLRRLNRAPLLLRFAAGAPPCGPAQEIAGMHFPNPVGLAAGMDKNAIALPAWEALGFGFIEVGTITPKPQPGNSRPRLFRYPQQQALINRLGFGNEGADVIAVRLARLKESGQWPRVPVGINLGKSKITPLAEAPADYLYSYRRLLSLGNYFVINVSSPNTPRLRELQDKEALTAIVRTLKEYDSTKPLFVKIAPEIEESQLDQIITLAELEGLTGIILTNTSLDHSAIPPQHDQQGGLSGAPLTTRATTLLRYATHHTKLPIIASGGMMSATSAKERFDAGAALVQIYTGFVYKGPQLIRDICQLRG